MRGIAIIFRSRGEGSAKQSQAQTYVTRHNDIKCSILLIFQTKQMYYTRSGRQHRAYSRFDGINQGSGVSGCGLGKQTYTRYA